MTQRYFFISQEGEVQPRWGVLLPEVVVVRSVDEAESAIPSNGIVWVSTTLPDWDDGVAVLFAAGARVIVLSTNPDPMEAARALDRGARGYAHAMAAPELLQQITGVVEAGGLWVGPHLMRRLIGTASRLASAGRVPAEDRELLLAALSNREREVAIAVAGGMANKEVARALGITERTVKAHLAAIFEKLEVRDRLHLALKLASAPEDKLPL